MQYTPREEYGCLYEPCNEDCDEPDCKWFICRDCGNEYEEG